MNNPIRLVLLARSLDYGGAQRQLVSLAKALDKSRFKVTVITFYGGPLARELDGCGVEVVSLNKRGRWDLIGFLKRLISQVRRSRPDILHGYLDIPNLLALFLKLVFSARVVWGLRASTIDLDHYGWLHRLAAQSERRLARFADLLIINSEAGRERHVAQGYPPETLTVVPNGFDTELFAPDSAAGKRLRVQWGVPEGTRLVGIVGRLDPMKDHQNFLRAAGLVLRRRDDVRFACIGDGPADYRKGLEALADELDLADKIIWKNASGDIVSVYNGLDVLVSSSRAEGLPNVVGEAMACGTPCVVTDVGDSRALLGDCGVVVPAQNPGVLAAGIIGCLAAEKGQLALRTRARIVAAFSLEQLASLTEAALMKVL